MSSSRQVNVNALVGSSFAAPAVLAMFGSIASLGGFKGDFLSFLFWQALAAITVIPECFALTLLIGWCLARVGWVPTSPSRSLWLTTALAAVCVAVCSNIPFLLRGRLSEDQVMLLTLLTGLGLNILVFFCFCISSNHPLDQDARRTGARQSA